MKTFEITEEQIEMIIDSIEVNMGIEDLYDDDTNRKKEKIAKLLTLKNWIEQA